jgi:pimeloyl-ACP methyl ester carboxylesterase
LVVVHGAGGDRARWAPVAPALAERFTLLLMDRRGRGLSGDAPEYTIARKIDDVLALVQAAGGGATLLGHSYGALCSIGAATRTDQPARVLLYEPPFATEGRVVVDEVVLGRIEQHLSQGDRERALVTFLREVVGVDDPTLELMRQAPAWSGRVAAAHTIARELRVAQRHVPSSARLNVPVRFLVGTATAPYLRAATAAAHAALAPSDVVELPGQGHVAMDTAPELFIAEVLRFAGAAAS